MNSKLLLLSFIFVTLIACKKHESPQDKNWTHFRGSDLNGIAAK